MNPQRILIIGGGEIGQAMAKLLASPSATIAIWDIKPEKSTSPSSLPHQVGEADFVCYCAPAASLRETLTQIASHLRPTCTLIVLAKGLEPSSGKTTDQVVLEALPMHQRTVFLGGPMLAEVLMRGTVAVAATVNQEAFEASESLFAPTPVVLIQSTDIRGVAVAGVLKNIYTLLIGMESVVTGSDNIRGVLIAQSLAEMTTLCIHLGGEAQTAQSIAGLGDFVATASSEKSANFSAGRSFALQEEPPMVSEGTLALPLLCAIIGDNLTSYPLLHKLERVVAGYERATDILVLKARTA